MTTHPETTPEILIGARGWNDPAWAAAFYPDDLPEEWRLSYYANEFRTVLVPAAQWRSGDLEAWREEVDEDFRFAVEVEVGTPEAELARLERLGRRLALLLVLADGAGPQALEQTLASLTALAPPAAVAIDAAVPAWPLLEQWRATPCWRPGVVGAGWRLGRLPAPQADLRQLRADLVAFAAGAAGERALLFPEGPPPPPERLRELVTLGQLLGL